MAGRLSETTLTLQDELTARNKEYDLFLIPSFQAGDWATPNIE